MLSNSINRSFSKSILAIATLSLITMACGTAKFQGSDGKRADTKAEELSILPIPTVDCPGLTPQQSNEKQIIAQAFQAANPGQAAVVDCSLPSEPVAVVPEAPITTGTPTNPVMPLSPETTPAVETPVVPIADPELVPGQNN